jgi:high-affinity Fe2+/Pb2+ permease
VFTIELWRSYWLLLDIYLFPKHQLYSSLICLSSGILVYSIVYLLKEILNKYLCENHEKESQSSIKDFKMFFANFQKLILLRLFIIVNFLAVIHIWRGLWLLQTLLVYRDDQVLLVRIIICFSCIFISLILLLCINRVSAILSRGNCKDELFFLKDKYIIIETLSKTVFSPRVG